jgi:hypothetical protein
VNSEGPYKSLLGLIGEIENGLGFNGMNIGALGFIGVIFRNILSKTGFPEQ